MRENGRLRLVPPTCWLHADVGGAHGFMCGMRHGAHLGTKRLDFGGCQLPCVVSTWSQGVRVHGDHIASSWTMIGRFLEPTAASVPCPCRLWIFFVALLCFQTFKKNSAWGGPALPTTCDMPVVSPAPLPHLSCRVSGFRCRVTGSWRLAPSSFKYAASRCERCLGWVGGECPPSCTTCALSAERVCEASHNTWRAAFGRALPLAHS